MKSSILKHILIYYKVCFVKKYIYILLPFLLYANCLAQIDIKDSSFSVITYWNKGEKMKYSVVQESYQLKDVDTVGRTENTYDIEIEVQDSTASAYLLKCKYLNNKTDSKDEFEQKILQLGNEISVIVKTNEYGIFQEVVNWREIKHFIKGALDTLRAMNTDKPNLQTLINQVAGMYNSKEVIENTTIKEIRRLLYFNGLKYKIGKMKSGDTKVANLYGGEPMDAYYELECTEVDTTDDFGVVRYYSEVDSDQATEATYNYLNSLTKEFNTEGLNREEFPQVTIQDLTVSSIEGYSGCVLYSINIKTAGAENNKKIERIVMKWVDLEGK